MSSALTRKIIFKELHAIQELKIGFSVLRELRTNLNWRKFLELLRAAERDSGYRLIGAFENGDCVGIIGYRILTDFVHGRHLYIDDLVVTAKKRSNGIGAEFLWHAESLAKNFDCRMLRLCAGVANKDGIRFYERGGWHLRAHAFKKYIC